MIPHVASAVAAPAAIPNAPVAKPVPVESPRAEPSARPAPVGALVKLDVRSEPEGAAVVHAVTGERLCETPCAASLPRGGSPVRLRVELAGHRPRTVSVTPNRDDSLHVRLSAVPNRPARPKAPAAASKDPNAPLNPFD